MSKVTLGMDGGGTKTSWCLVGADGEIGGQGTAGRGNVAVIDDAELLRLFEGIRRDLPVLPAAVGAGMAGVLGAKEEIRVEGLLRRVFPEAETIVARSDMQSGFWAAHPDGQGILVVAGTGSFVLGRENGRWVRADGWGHLAGDRGSAYDLAESGVRALFLALDETGEIPGIGQTMLAFAALNTMDELSLWLTQNAGNKGILASLAPAVVAASEAGCPVACACLQETAGRLAGSVAAVVRRLQKADPVVVLQGGLLLHAASYREAVLGHLAALVPAAQVRLGSDCGARGAARLAGEALTFCSASQEPLPVEVRCSPTESQNPRTRHLEKRPVAELVELFLEESERVVPALRQVVPQLVQATERVASALQDGGRLFYVGAGTSGRLGVLDASEVPPTFGVSPAVVQGIMAGGLSALALGVEDVEDDRPAGAEAVRSRGVRAGDVVIGIAASGRTPFVVAAMKEARLRKACIGFLSCNPQRPPLPFALDFAVDIPTEPEFLCGSTRLAAGTATKIALNLLSTLAMIRLGKVRDSLMIDVQATNAKLKDRALRIVMQLTGWSEAAALTALSAQDWNVRSVLASAAAAERGGSVR